MRTFEEIYAKPPHDFVEDLKKSEAPEVYALVMPAIQHWWPHMAGWEREKNLAKQKRGHDMNLEGEIYSPSLQGKVRWTSFDDMAIEYEHVFHDGRIKPGWIRVYSSDEIDWLIYTQVPLRKVTRIDMESLLRAWAENEERWRLECVCKSSPNREYDSWNCFVPWDMLMRDGVILEHIEIPAPIAQPAP